LPEAASALARNKGLALSQLLLHLAHIFGETSASGSGSRQLTLRNM